MLTTGWGEPIYPDTVTSLMAKGSRSVHGLLCSLLYATTGAGIRPAGVPSQQRAGSGAIHDLAYVPYDNPRWGATELPSGLEPAEELAEDRVLDRSVRRHAMGVVGSLSLADVVEGDHEPAAAVGSRRAHVCLEDRQFNRL